MPRDLFAHLDISLTVGNAMRPKSESSTRLTREALSLSVEEFCHLYMYPALVAHGFRMAGELPLPARKDPR